MVFVEDKTYNNVWIDPSLVRAIIPAGSAYELYLEGGRIIRVRLTNREWSKLTRALSNKGGD